MHLAVRRAAQLKPETRRLYAADWAAFALWCRDDDQTALPTEASTLAAYLQDQAVWLGPGTLARRLAAILEQHRRQGLQAPAQDPAVWAMLREARREAPPRRRTAPSATQLTHMAGACPGDLAGLRDRALLLVAAKDPARASEPCRGTGDAWMSLVLAATLAWWCRRERKW